MSDVVFISGHRNITQEEFTEHYTDAIVDAVLDGCSFVVGDCLGCDFRAQQLLIQSGCEDVTVYHMGDTPTFYVDDLDTKGDFVSHIDRDWAMSLVSDRDLCWIRKGKERSGTAQNVQRRKLKEDGVNTIQEVMTLEASMFL